MSRVLVVEDNPDLAFGLRNNLEIEGYEVLVAGDGPTGLTRARDWVPDLVAKATATARMMKEGLLSLHKRGSRLLWSLRIWRCVRT